MAKTHGRVAVLKIDSLAGVLSDVSAYLDQASYKKSTDRPETQTFGQTAKRREVLGLQDAAISVRGFFQPAASTKVHGRNNVVLHGQYSIGSYFDQSSVKRSVDLPETQTFGNSWKRREVVGLKDGSVSLSGYFDSATGASDAVLRAAAAASTGSPVTLGPNGMAIGALVEMLSAMHTGYDSPVNENEANKISTEIQADGGVDLGVSLHALGIETGTGDYTSVDETAATANGGWAHLHVTAVDTLTTATIKVQHSTDDITFADLITFTAVTAVGSERKEAATGVTVNRYVRAALTTLTGTSITFAVAFARRDFAYGTVGTYRHWVGLLGNANTQTFELGQTGSTAGYPKLTGECRMGSLEITVNENDVITFSGELMTDSTVTETTY